MAFSSTFIVCGEAGTSTATHTFSSTPTILITSFFCLLALVSVAFNFRKGKTPWALLMVALGAMAVLQSASTGGGLSLYYAGTFIMFVGVWYNGSMMHFVGKIRNWIYSKTGVTKTIETIG